MKKKACLLAVAATLLFAVLGMFSYSALRASAEGSADLVFYGGYRPYLEYSTNTTAGIERRTIIRTYVKAGETVCFGSSVTGSKLDIYHNNIGAVSGVDIVVVDPDGVSTGYDVISGGVGHIATRAQEEIGPNYNARSPGGYEPFSFTAATTGIYSFHFHSLEGAQNASTSQNPTVALYNAVWKENIDTVAAWDVTVFDGTNKKTGRSSTKLLALNTGSQSATMNSNVYVVTTDGYVYQTDFNGIGPYGFLFAASNRGLIDAATNTSAYRSYLSSVNSLADYAQLGVMMHNPLSANTAQDQTYDVYFNPLDNEMFDLLYPTPYEPRPAENFRFVGVYGDNSTVVNYGGWFYFDVTHATSATVFIDLTHVNMIDENGVSQTVNLGVVRLDGAVSAGRNSFYWDGCDANGNPLPKGVYDNSSIQVEIDTHSGEYHFPLFDVENSANGIIVRRINPIYREVLNPDTGTYQNVDVTAEYAASAGYVYYNNNFPGAVSGAGIGDGLDHSVNPIDSTNPNTPALKFNKAAQPWYGDRSMIDIWTYAIGERLVVPLSEEIIIEDTLVSVLDGLVFYDYNQDGVFNVSDGDFVLKDVTITLEYSYDETVTDPATGLVSTFTKSVTETTTTDSNGVYRFFGVVSGETPHTCTITITKPYDFYSVTTETISTSVLPDTAGASATVPQNTNGTIVQTFTLGGTIYEDAANVYYSPVIEMSDVGFYFVSDDSSYEIKKDWIISKYFDAYRPLEIYVDYAGGYYDASGSWVEIITGSERLTELISWRVTLNGLPTQYLTASGDVEQLIYIVVNERFVHGGISWDYASNNADADYPYVTSILNEMLVSGFSSVVTNAPLGGSIQVTKRDVDSYALVSDCTFLLEMEDENGIWVAVGSKTTDSQGVVYFPNLQYGNYRLTETATPINYQPDSTPVLLTVDADNSVIDYTFYNEMQTAYVSLDKVFDVLIPDPNSSIAPSGSDLIFAFTLEWADNPQFDNATHVTRQITLASGVLTYSGIFDNFEVPIGSYVRITEQPTRFYLQDPTQSRLTLSTDGGRTETTLDSQYVSGETFYIDGAGNYKVTLQNVKDVLETIYFQKIWIDYTGQVLDYNQRQAAATSGFASVRGELQVSADGGTTWTKILYKYPTGQSYGVVRLTDTEMDIVGTYSAIFESVPAISGNQRIWVKRLGAQYWNLPIRDETGNPLIYRYYESELPSGWAQYTGAVDYTATGVNFINPILNEWQDTLNAQSPDEHVKTSYYTLDYSGNTYTMNKSDYQQNMYIINYQYDTDKYSLSVNKRESVNLSPLVDAEFTLYRAATAEEIAAGVGIVQVGYGANVIDCISVGTAVSALNSDQTAATAALYSIIDIDTDYYLVETNPPIGYRKLASALKIRVELVNQSPVLYVDDVVTAGAVSADNVITLTVDNYALPVLSDAGSETTPALLFGTAIMLFGAGLFLALRRKRKS